MLFPIVLSAQRDARGDTLLRMSAFIIVADGEVRAGKEDARREHYWKELLPETVISKNEIIFLFHTQFLLFVDFWYFYIDGPFGFFFVHGYSCGNLPLLLGSEFSVILVAGVVGDSVALAVVALPIAYEVFLGFRSIDTVHIVPDLLSAAGGSPNPDFGDFALQRTVGVVGITHEEAVALSGFSVLGDTRSEPDAVFRT